MCPLVSHSFPIQFRDLSLKCQILTEPDHIPRKQLLTTSLLLSYSSCTASEEEKQPVSAESLAESGWVWLGWFTFGSVKLILEFWLPELCVYLFPIFQFNPTIPDTLSWQLHNPHTAITTSSLTLSASLWFFFFYHNFLRVKVNIELSSFLLQRLLSYKEAYSFYGYN